MEHELINMRGFDHRLPQYQFESESERKNRHHYVQYQLKRKNERKVARERVTSLTKLKFAKLVNLIAGSTKREHRESEIHTKQNTKN